MNKNTKTSRAFTLMEMMLGLIILAAGIYGVYRLLGAADATANIERESKNFGSLATGVQGAFLSKGNFTGLTTKSAIDLGIPGLKVQGEGEDAQLVSEFGAPIVVRPATVRVTDDAFDVVYHGLDEGACVKMIKASYAQSYQILVNEESDLSGNIARPGSDVQMVAGSEQGRLLPDSALTQSTRCGAPAFKDKQGIVAFRIYTYQSAVGPEAPPACTCTPREQTQFLDCPAGYSGQITQTRQSTCTGGTPSCPTEEWGLWNTTQNTCTQDPTCTTPPCGIGPPPPPPPSCTPYTQTRTQECAPGETGIIQQSRNATCPNPNGPHVFTAWVTTQNTCQSSVTVIPCVESTQERDQSCPVGQGGSIKQRRQSTCPSPTGAPVWGPWTTYENTCTTSCVVTGNCCAPDTQTRVQSCPVGFTGNINQRRNATCASATATPVWGDWFDENNACVPAGVCTVTNEYSTILLDTRDAFHDVQYTINGVTVSCRVERRLGDSPSGCDPGSVVDGNTIVSYLGWRDLAAPGDTYYEAGSSSGWEGGDGEYWTGVQISITANPAGTCGGTCSAPAPVNETQNRWVNATDACPAPQTGNIVYEAEQSQSRTTSYSCPDPNGAPQATVGSWSAWANTGARRNEVNTCAPASYGSCEEAFNAIIALGNVCYWDYGSCNFGNIPGPYTFQGPDAGGVAGACIATNLDWVTQLFYINQPAASQTIQWNKLATP